MKKMQFLMGIYLAMQALTCFLLVILFLLRGKKNSAGVFLTAGSISGICGALMLYKQIKAKMEDSRLSQIIEELCSLGDAEEEDETPSIPLDEMADEAEFQM